VEVHERDVTRVRGAAPGQQARAVLLLATGIAASGCAASTKQVKAPRYNLTMPGFWQVKAEGKSDGQPTTIIIGRPGTMFSDEGPGPQESRKASDPAVPADVEVRLHAWDAAASPADATVLRSSTELEATQQAAGLLASDPNLQLSRHVLIAEQPPECGLARRRYDLFGASREPLDVVSRPGWRVIIVGGKSHGSLLGAVARVPYELDVDRYCLNLRNMQVQLQNLLAGLQAVVSPVVPPPPPPPSENLDTKPTL
jgi:hypothetical protein